MQKEIAIRFYENKRFGTTYGKGKYHRAILNATADITHPKVKYLLDMHSFDDWRNTAKSDEDMEIIQTAEDLIKSNKHEDYLATWIARLDSDAKPRVGGFGLLDTNTGGFTLLIADEENDIEDIWKLTAKPCKTVIGKQSPQLLATNTDLNL